MNIELKNTLVFAAGAVIGALASKWYMEYAFEKAMKEAMEEAMEETATVRERKPGHKMHPHSPQVTLKEVGRKPHSEENVKEYNNIARRYGTDVEAHAKLPAETRAEVYPIDGIDFNQTPENYDQEELTFYAGNEMLMDGNNEEVEDPHEMIGAWNVNNIFDENPDNPNVAYIRNEFLKIDFEVLRVPDSYLEEDPNAE